MQIANNYEQLEKQINKELMAFLKSEFRDWLEEVEIKMAYKYVYSYKATEWAMAKRRMDRGGLIDRDNNFKIWNDKANNGILYYNDTRPQDRDRGKVQTAIPIEKGDEEWMQPYPRPFVYHTFEQVSNNEALYKHFRKYFDKNTKNLH